MINGGATSSGDQDTEDTELMAIYTTENGIAEKVRGPSLPGGNSFLFSKLSLFTAASPGCEVSCLRAADLQIHITPGSSALMTPGHTLWLQHLGHDSGNGGSSSCPWL